MRLPRPQTQALLLTFAIASGCGRGGPGAPCSRVGDGFLARHDCATFCLAFPIDCPDGTRPIPHVCAGAEHCVEGACPTGQACIRVNVDRSFCVPDAICPSWRTMGVAQPVLTPDEEVARRLRVRPQPPAPVAIP